MCILYVEHVHQTLMFSHVIHDKRHLGKVSSGFIHENKRVMIIRRRTLHTPKNRKNHKNCKNWWNTMPRTMRLRPVHGNKASAISRMLHPYTLIRNEWPTTCLRKRVEWLVLVGQNNLVVRRGSTVTDSFIMRHEYLPNKELNDTKRMVHITE